MSRRDYIISVLPEAILLVVVSTSLAYYFSTGFVAGEGISGCVPIALAVCAVLTAVLHAIAWSKRTALVGGVSLAVVLLVAFAIALAVGGGANVLEDTEGNLVLFASCVVLTCIGCFLLSRKVVLCALLVVGGAFACGVMQYLYQEGHAVSFAVFIVSAASLLMCRVYRAGLVGSLTRRTAFAPTAGFALFTALVAVGLSALVFFVVIAPLDSPALEVKLITEYKALEELPRRGTSETLSITDPDLTSTVLNGEFTDAQEDDTERETETDSQGTSVAESVQEARQSIGSSLGYAADGAVSLFDLITFNQKWYGFVLLIVLAVLVLVAPWVIKHVTRKRFLDNALLLPPRECVKTLYERFMRNFSRLGVGRAQSATPFEFAVNTQRELAIFSLDATDGGFMRVTSAFARASFGDKEPTSADIAACRNFYGSFFSNARKYAGVPKYIRLYFRL